MTLKQKLIDFSKGKEKITLKEYFSAFQDLNKNSIMAVLNSEIKKGTTFERISKATYKLKDN